jgi:hypothetical protein
MYEEGAERVEVDGVARLQVVEVKLAEASRERKSIRAVVLEASLVKLFGAVERGVVARDAVGVGEVEAGCARALEDRHVRVVRQPLVDGVHERVGDRVRRCRKLADERAVAFARLEHHGGAARAARLEVEHERHALHRRVLAREAARAEESEFFGVREDDEEVVAERRAGLQRAQSFEQSGDARAVVRSARPRRHGVVMRGEHQSLAVGGSSGHARDDVLHSRRGYRKARSRLPRHDLRGLHLRAHAERRQLAEDVAAHALDLFRAGRVRPPRKHAHVAQRARRRELRRGRALRHGPRRPREPDAQPRRRGQKKKSRQGRGGVRLRVAGCVHKNRGQRPEASESIAGFNRSTPRAPDY